MNTFFFCACIIFLILWLNTLGSKKETTREKYGEAIIKIVCSVANMIAKITFYITEPTNKRKIRLAKEVLAMRNGLLYEYRFLSNYKETVERYLKVDESFKKSLDVLELPEERWRIIGKHLFYVGVIRRLSYCDSNYEDSVRLRNGVLSEWVKDRRMADQSNALREALNYFNISEDDWIKYGDYVIKMYNINDDEYIRKFGFVTEVNPTMSLLANIYYK